MDPPAWLPELNDMPVVADAGLRLRGARDDDLDALQELWTHADVMRYWSTPALGTREECARKLAQMQGYFAARDALAWIVAATGDDAVLGTLTLFRIDAAQRRCELGYALLHRYWGRGLALRAVNLALDFAFGPLDLMRIEADIDPRNVGSVRLIERAGFRREGLLRERWRVGGEVQDSAIYGLLRHDPRGT